MGELWALPIFLRYCLIEFLSLTLVSIIHPSKLPNLPEIAPQLSGFSNAFSDNGNSRETSANNDNVANTILSLRAISEQNWSDFFESVSCLERKLRQDPSGIYPRMDFKTRDIYRKEIETLSIASGRDENDLAEIILNLASSKNAESIPIQNGFSTLHSVHAENKSLQSVEIEKGLGEISYPEKGTHVGEYLLGKGRATLEKKIGYQADRKTRFKRWVLRHASAVYLTSIFLLTFLLLGIIAFAARLPDLIKIITSPATDTAWIATTFFNSSQSHLIVFIDSEPGSCNSGSKRGDQSYQLVGDTHGSAKYASQARFHRQNS